MSRSFVAQATPLVRRLLLRLTLRATEDLAEESPELGDPPSPSPDLADPTPSESTDLADPPFSGSPDLADPFESPDLGDPFESPDLTERTPPPAAEPPDGMFIGSPPPSPRNSPGSSSDTTSSSYDIVVTPVDVDNYRRFLEGELSEDEVKALMSLNTFQHLEQQGMPLNFHELRSLLRTEEFYQHYVPIRL